MIPRASARPSSTASTTRANWSASTARLRSTPASSLPRPELRRACGERADAQEDSASQQVNPVAVDRKSAPATSDGLVLDPPVRRPNATNGARVTADGVVLDPPVKSPVAVHREVAPTSNGVVLDPPVHSPIAVKSYVAPTAGEIIVVDPPVNSTNAVNGR